MPFRIRNLAPLCILLFSTSLSAQLGASQLTTLLAAQFRGKSMPVRDFLANPVIHYAWNGTAFIHEPQFFFSAGLFTASKVTVSGPADAPQMLVLEGKLQTILKKEDGGPYKTYPLDTPTRFEVDLTAADQNAILSIGSSLFYPDLQAMLNDVPKQWQRLVPGLINFPSPNSSLPHNTWIRQNRVWRELGPKDKDLKMPEVVQAPKPEFSPEAKQKGVSGSVRVGILVADDGSVEEVWLLRPLGAGLDQTSANAVRRYKFKPALYQGIPVAAILAVETTFAIYN